MTDTPPNAATQEPERANAGVEGNSGSSAAIATSAPPVSAAPMTAEALVDLRRRVLANEPVSDDELRHALSSLAMARGTAPTGAKTATAVYEAKGSIADRFAAFKAKSQKTDTAGDPVVDKGGEKQQ